MTFAHMPDMYSAHTPCPITFFFLPPPPISLPYPHNNPSVTECQTCVCFNLDDIRLHLFLFCK